MDLNDSKKVYKFHKNVLIHNFGLQAPNVCRKTITDSGDLLALLSFNIAYDYRVFPSERQRLNVAACYFILAYTGCQPAEVVDGDKNRPWDGSWEELFSSKAILPLLQKPPEDDAYAKELTKLLERETTHRSCPRALCYEDIQTIFFFMQTKRLIFCLVTLVASIAILDDAFDFPTLTSVEAVFRARNCSPVTCTPLRWKKEWLKRPVFQWCDGDPDSPLLYCTLHDYIGNQSLDMGYEKHIGPKDWRRNVGNTVNGYASGAMRHQIMRHNSHLKVFQDAYLNSFVQYDVLNAVLNEPLQTKLLSMLSHVGHMRDPCASSDMVPDEVWTSLPPDLEIVELEKRREALKGGMFGTKGCLYEREVQLLTATSVSMQARRKKAVKLLYRKYYFHNHPIWDLLRQANGEAPTEHDKPEIDLQLADRAALAELLYDQPDGLSPEKLHWHCIMVGTHMVRLGQLKERIRPDIEHKKVMPNSAARHEPCRDKALFPSSKMAPPRELRLHPRPLLGPMLTSMPSNSDGSLTLSLALSDDSAIMQISASSLDYGLLQ
ncbi:uncharacterized protein BT62DRAFT_1074364 [Guyanagaster necrorhizus]|uniref:Uncharacterized protein n=1 Tax=Guyanagaster necrorhizus TaxID=856835 RepID=A0A9P8AV14_9AGAR|nr:uncharacterized protein BT62DRAFT_1074364 [Guyanagaster necrorhizus MCA 3950]KAG7448835.1 hypothetical protein BT62DRAFT_1074364 [Guyanagaster necrorhizus MCA 3950]